VADEKMGMKIFTFNRRRSGLVQKSSSQKVLQMALVMNFFTLNTIEHLISHTPESNVFFFLFLETREEGKKLKKYNWPST